MDGLLLTAILLGFLAVVLLCEGGYLLWNTYRGADALHIQSRLALLNASGRLSGESRIIKERLLRRSAALERWLQRLPRAQYLDRLLLQSGTQRTAAGLVFLTTIFAVAGLIVWLVLPLPLWSASLCVAGAAALPALHILRARRIRLRRLEEQLPDALELMSRALRAGHAFASALQMVGTEGPEPIAGEFAVAFDEINYGVQTQDALLNLGARVPVSDLRFFVVAVAIQRETGGNLTELLDKLAGLMLARILTVLPIALLLIINLINPKFMSILWTDPAGKITCGIGLTLMIIGIVWMSRTVKIRV
jgi:tight adherence protein B